MPKGILKNARPIPTKRSVSECVDDLSQIMAHLNLDINDLPKATGKFCPRHSRQQPKRNHDQLFKLSYFDELEEDEGEEEDEDSENRSTSNDLDYEDEDDENQKYDGKECDCNLKFGDNGDNNKPKKSVRFDERVYETVFFASRLYDRRYFNKVHFSTRHHPPSNQVNKSKRNHKNSSSSKPECKDEQSKKTTSSKSDNASGCKLSKSQRAKQSKKDKKKRLNKREEVTDTSSDDQGYCSSMHSFSD